MKDYNYQFGLVGTGLALWIVGLVLNVLLPAFAAVAVVLVVAGHFLFWLGVIVFILSLVISFIKSLLS